MRSLKCYTTEMTKKKKKMGRPADVYAIKKTKLLIDKKGLSFAQAGKLIYENRIVYKSQVFKWYNYDLSKLDPVQQ